MKLSTARKKYKDEWMAFNINKEGDDPEGKVLYHHKNRDIFDKQWPKLKANHLYVTFNGPSIEPGKVFMLVAA